MNITHKIAIGIDVCKTHLDVYHSALDSHQQFENNPSGFAALLDWLTTNVKPDIVVLEATGGYEEACWEYLFAAQYPVARVNPKRPRDFARASGVLAKTDRVDARILANFGLCLDVQPTQPKATGLKEMQAWLVRRGQLMEMRVAESNRRRMAPKEVQKRMDLHLRQLQKEIDLIDETLAEQIKTSKHGQAKMALLADLKGIGLQTRAWLLSGLPELGHYNRRQIASLVGLAPFTRESGNYKGRSRVYGGRTAVRTALYMATLSAVRHDARLRLFYQRLLSAGKPKKVALVAAMRKLLTIINAVFKSGERYQVLPTTVA